MKIDIRDASQLQLDWLVTSLMRPEACEYGVADWREQRKHKVVRGEYVDRWTSSWMQAGEIIEQDGIVPAIARNGQFYVAWKGCASDFGLVGHYVGTTPLIAVARCFVASRMGEMVEIPEELVEDSQRTAQAERPRAGG